MHDKRIKAQPEAGNMSYSSRTSSILWIWIVICQTSMSYYNSAIGSLIKTVCVDVSFH